MVDIDKLSIEITASTTSAINKIEKLTGKLGELSNAINAVDTSKFVSLSNAVNSLSEGLKGIKGSSLKNIGKLSEKIENVSDSARNLDKVAEGAENIGNSAHEASNSVGNLADMTKDIQTRSLEEISAKFKKISTDALTADDSVKGLKGILANLKIIVPTEDLDKVTKKFNQVKEKAQELKDKIDYKSSNIDGYVDSDAMKKDQQDLEGLINELERLRLKKQELESHGGFRANLGNFKALGKDITALIGKVDAFLGRLKKLAFNTKNTAKQTEHFKFSSDKLAKSLTRTAKMLRLMVVRMVLRAAITNTTQGFKNLAQYSDEFNASMSLLWNSLRQTGNAIAAMVSPLINALAPALNYVIQLLIKFINAINQVFSALTGKGTWTSAKKLTDSWADSLDKSSKKAKKLKHELLGFDALNNISDNQSADVEMTSPADMFEEKAIDPKLKAIADKIKKILDKMKEYALRLLKPIKKAWEKVGDEVIKSWKGAFESIGKLIGDIAEDFIEVWEQPQTQRMLENILHIIANIGKFIDVIAQKLDEAWNKNNTGKKILEDIRDIFSIVVEHAKSLTDRVVEWASKLDFSPLLTAIEKGLNALKPVVDTLCSVFDDFVLTVFLPFVQYLTEKGIPNLIDVFVAFTEKVDWEHLKAKLHELWLALEPFLETVWNGVVGFIGDLADAVARFVNSDKFDGFIDALIKFMNNVNADDVKNALKKITEAFLGFEALKGVATIITALSKVGSIASLKATLVVTVTIAGLKAGSVLGKWLTGEDALYDNFKWFGEGGFFDTIFGEITIGSSWVDILQKIVDLLSEIKTAWDDLKSSVFSGNPLGGLAIGVEKFANNSGIGKGLGMVTTASDTIKTIQALYGNYKKVSNETTNSSAKDFEDLSTNIKNSTSKIKSDLESSSKSFNITDTATKSANEWKSASDNIASSTENIKTKTQTLSEYLKNDTSFKQYSDKASSSYSLLNDSAKKSLDDFKNKTKATYTEVEAQTYNFQTHSSAQVKELVKTVDSGAKDIKSTTDNVKKEFSADKWTSNGVTTGLRKSFENAVKVVKQIIAEFARWVNEKFTININPINIGGKQITSGGKIKLFRIPGFAMGGFPEDGLFMANHNEMVGKFSNGSTAVANNGQIVDGIKYGVATAMAEQNNILLQQNELLREIVAKDFGISEGELFRSVQSSANSFQKRTGRYAFNT